jgi:hypothetical protein
MVKITPWSAQRTPNAWTLPTAPVVDVGTGAHADSFTLIIGGVGAVAVPEPSGSRSSGSVSPGWRRPASGADSAGTDRATERGASGRPLFSNSASRLGLAGLAHSGTGANR